MFIKVRSKNTSPSPKHNFVMNPPVSFVFDMHIDQGERHRLHRASSYKDALCCEICAVVCPLSMTLIFMVH